MNRAMGMGKDAARALVDRGTLTWGDLKHMLDMAAIDADGEPARLNRSITRAGAHAIFVAALAGYADNVRVNPSSNRDFVMASNVLREFGAARAQDPT